MPSVNASVPYLDNLPLYHIEKPFTLVREAGTAHNEFDGDITSNIQVKHTNITILDTREHSYVLDIERSGFTLLHSPSYYLEFGDHVNNDHYKRETEQMLKKTLNADFVLCWDLKVK